MSIARLQARFDRIARLAAAALLLALAVAASAVAQQSPAFPKSALTIETASGTHRFNIELAQTPEQMSFGLMFRKQMAPDAGMLFVYESPRMAAMWMKNTYIPLDMVFIGADGRIVNIAERTVPHSEATVASNGPVRATLELNGGTASRLGIKPGDRVRHEAFK
ncbi:MAG: DUF192 domain-containing protein [Alphaproteobacteria bacterium]|nr:DUF192 domain-containing protein [Alphaproteobacteria bacterium]